MANGTVIFTKYEVTPHSANISVKWTPPTNEYWNAYPSVTAVYSGSDYVTGVTWNISNVNIVANGNKLRYITFDVNTAKGMSIFVRPGHTGAYISGGNYTTPATSYKDFINFTQPTPITVTGSNVDHLLPGTSGTIRFSLMSGYSWRSSGITVSSSQFTNYSITRDGNDYVLTYTIDPTNSERNVCILTAYYTDPTGASQTVKDYLKQYGSTQAYLNPCVLYADKDTSMLVTHLITPTAATAAGLVLRDAIENNGSGAYSSYSTTSLGTDTTIKVYFDEVGEYGSADLLCRYKPTGSSSYTYLDDDLRIAKAPSESSVTFTPSVRNIGYNESTDFQLAFSTGLSYSDISFDTDKASMINVSGITWDSNLSKIDVPLYTNQTQSAKTGIITALNSNYRRAVGVGYATINQDVLTELSFNESNKIISANTTSAVFAFTQSNYTDVQATISGIEDASVSISNVDWKTYNLSVTLPVNSTNAIKTATITVTGVNGKTGVTDTITATLSQYPSWKILNSKLWIDAFGMSPGTIDIQTGGDVVLSSNVVQANTSSSTYSGTGTGDKRGYVTVSSTGAGTYRITLTYDPDDTRYTLEQTKWLTWTYTVSATIEGEPTTFTFVKRCDTGYVVGRGDMKILPRTGGSLTTSLTSQGCWMSSTYYTSLASIRLIGVEDGISYTPLITSAGTYSSWNGPSSSVANKNGYLWSATGTCTIGEATAASTKIYRDYYLIPGLYDFYDHTVIREADNAPYSNIIIRQYLYDPYISFTQDSQNVSWNTTSATFTFTYETTLIDNDFSNWSVSGTNLQSYNFRTVGGVNYCDITFTSNSSTSDKTTAFTITAPTIFTSPATISSTMYVTQGPKPHIIVTPSTVSIDGVGGTKSWTINAIGYSDPVFSIPTITGSFTLSNTSMTYPTATSMNYQGDIPVWSASSGSRTCTISFTCKERNDNSINDTKTSVITQTAVVPTLTIASGTKSINADGTFSFTFTGKYVGIGWNLTSSAFNIRSFTVTDNSAGSSWSSAHTFTITGSVDPNLTLSSKTGTFVLTCTSLNGIAMSATANVSQASGGAYVTFTPSTNLISNNGGTIHSTVTTNIPNPTITLSSGVSWMTISGTDIIVAASSTLSSNRSGVITCTVTGGGYTKTATATITQYPKTFTITPASKTIAYDITSTSFSVIATSMSNLSCNISGITNATATLEYVSEDTYNVNVTLPANTGMINKTGTVTVSGTNAGSTFTKNATLTQEGVGMSITPATKTTNSAKATFTVYCRSSYTPNSLISSGTAQVDSYSYTYVGTVSSVKEYLLTINLIRNTGNTDLTLTVTPTDTINGVTSNNSAVLTQRPSSEPSIVINPESMTILAAATATSFGYSAVNVTNLVATISESGTATVDTANNVINIVVPANTAETAVTRTVTVTGVDDDGNTVTGTATLIQAAIIPAAQLTLSPSTVSYNGGTVNAVVTTNISSNTKILSSNVDWISINNLVLTAAPNQAGTDRTATITVTVTDTNDPTRVATANAVLTQGQFGGRITISPSTQVVDGIGARFNVYAEDTTPTGVVANGEVEVVNFTYTFVDVVDGKDHYTLDLELSPNMGAGNISSIIIPTSVDSTGESATLTQRPFTGIDVIPTSYNFEATGGAYVFRVYTNGMNMSTLAVTISDSDISSLTASLNAAKTGLEVVCGASTTTSATSAVITVSGSTTGGASVSKSIAIHQAAAVPYINISPKTQTVSSATGRAYVNVISTFDVPSWSVSQDYTGSMIINSVSNDYDNNRVQVIYGSNNTTTTRYLTLHIRGTSTSTGETITATATIYQEAGLTAGITPVWKDAVFTDNTSSSFLEYHIDCDGETLYAGKIYKMPDEDVMHYSVNDVVSNYLGNGITFAEGIEEIPNYSKEFSIITTGANHQLKVYNSWAYEDTDYWLSDPIDYRVSCKQWLPVSFISTNYAEISINSVRYPVSAVDKGWTVNLDLSEMNLGDEITVVGGNREIRKYKIADGDYVLYYANAFGGWDSLLCNAASRKTDNIETLSYKTKTYNRSNFSKIDYQKTITPTWTLKTGLIKDGSKMYHLLESTMVYLHNLETNEIIPVTITNSTCDYLNYTNNGKKPVSYSITVEESNQKIRK